ncbi:S-adenosyl-L-methionine-dependent methyltransferase [Chaetomium fimeti]|uniref:DNA (cytosine-5-)-methyltransferase n=1 Tax=Chaetomium fimeti TaxID=1854472 RepID=A0AAE0LUS1_9PEZI|nr:S-adenosyl-L-methionine-dependent methyltransferase [Chaetomium fimeti]
MQKKKDSSLPTSMSRNFQCAALGAQHNPLVIDDDENLLRDLARRTRRIKEEAQTGRRLAEWVASHARQRGSNERESPSEDDHREVQIENALEEGISSIIDLTGDDTPIIEKRVTVPRQDVRHITSCDLANGIRIRPGMTVELNNPIGASEIQFLKVADIIRLGLGPEIVIRGPGFTRTRHLDGMLLPKLNEVAMVAEFRGSSGRQCEEEVMFEVKSTDIRRARALRITSAPFPEYRFSDSEYASNGRRWVEQNSILVCRYRYDIHYHRDSDKPHEWAFLRICEEDADPDFRMSNESNLNRWRGGKVPGGSYTPYGLSHPVLDLESGPSSYGRTISLFSPGQRYTAGDVFSGAGGASRGIERAGVQLLFAVDNWPPAVESLRSNFGRSHVFDLDVTDFITSSDTQHRVDILHLSPPCQFWSPAHTVAGKNDEHNIAVLFSCTHLVENHKPRLFTVEQTFGILSPRFKEFFNTFLHGFTKLGYSVRWKVLPLASYGVPQLRKRLIMIGSAPGERLPPFPPPTHNKDGTGGLKPWTTPKSVLASLSPNLVHKLHEPGLSKRFDPPKKPWDPTQLAKTITTDGGRNYHWDGERDFTLLEYAVLQGFPTWYKFEGAYIKKQIGNAFAPSVVKVLYDHLVDWLLVQDGFDPSARRSPRAGMPSDVSSDKYICLDDNNNNHYNVTAGSTNGSSTRRLSDIVRQFDQAAENENRNDELMDLNGLSDTETLRGDEMDHGIAKEIELGGDCVVDLIMEGWGRGTAADPCVLSD